MKTTNTVWLTVEVAKTLVGKTISWRAPMDEENWDDYDTPKFYEGKCRIIAVHSDNSCPLEVKTISGNNLSFAILENEELLPVDGSDTRFSLCPATGDKRTFTYSDLYREVEVIDVKEAEEAEETDEEEDEIIEVMFSGDCTAESKQFERYLIEFFKIWRLNAGVNVKIIKANYDDRTQLSGVYSVNDAKKIKKMWFSLNAFVTDIAENIGFEIAERQQTSDSITLVNESNFKLSATKVEA